MNNFIFSVITGEFYVDFQYFLNIFRKFYLLTEFLSKFFRDQFLKRKFRNKIKMKYYYIVDLWESHSPLGGIVYGHRYECHIWIWWFIVFVTFFSEIPTLFFPRLWKVFSKKFHGYLFNYFIDLWCIFFRFYIFTSYLLPYAICDMHFAFVHICKYILHYCIWFIHFYVGYLWRTFVVENDFMKCKHKGFFFCKTLREPRQQIKYFLLNL